MKIYNGYERLPRNYTLMSDEYEFTMIEGRMLDAPRYSFLKNVECDGIKYDVEIDNLSRTFCLFEN